MITVTRYRPSATSRLLYGAPLADSVGVVYTLSKTQVRSRLVQALRSGAEGVSISDLLDIDAGHLREAVLERLFDAETLARALLGLEEDAERTFYPLGQSFRHARQGS